jgi:hypothetical protein
MQFPQSNLTFNYIAIRRAEDSVQLPAMLQVVVVCKIASSEYIIQGAKKIEDGGC